MAIVNLYQLPQLFKFFRILPINILKTRSYNDENFYEYLFYESQNDESNGKILFIYNIYERKFYQNDYFFERMH